MNQSTHIDNVKLSEREQQVLTYIADGLTSKEIAIKLLISKYTVDNHRRNMLKKGGVKSSAQLCLLSL